MLQEEDLTGYEAQFAKFIENDMEALMARLRVGEGPTRKRGRGRFGHVK